MSPDTTSTFTQAADPYLCTVRGSLLLVVQTGEVSAIGPAADALEKLWQSACEAGIYSIRDLSEQCLKLLPELSTATPEQLTDASLQALDKLAEIEAAIFRISLESGGFLDEASTMIDAIFEDEHVQIEQQLAAAQFDIDEETLEVFRDEAAQLLSRIGAALGVLDADHYNREALWEIRRSAHTFKGSAGILGIHDMAEIAHQLENVLDTVVDDLTKVNSSTIGYMRSAADALGQTVLCGIVKDRCELDRLYESVTSHLGTPEMTQAADVVKTAAPSMPTPTVETPPRPVVRVSVDRLDEIIELSRNLLLNRSGLVDCCAANQTSGTADLDELNRLLETSREITEQIQQKLQNIRMIRFGTLQTRLLRAVNATCTDLGKKADLVVVNGDVEIDTELMDCLVEPLLHILKNAVVHGIELPEKRRLLGKPVKGLVTVSVQLDHNFLVVDVSDDGGGISTHELVHHAAELGIDTSTENALDLVFERGLTTAQSIDLNAGRGVGMSIVRDCVEARGGTVTVRSSPQRGTSFMMRLPLLATLTNQTRERPVTAEAATVLVVDDSPTIRSQMAGMLKGLGLTVLMANDGADALRKLRVAAVKPDLILSDIEMPHVDGWSLLDSIKTDAGLLHIPVVMVTSLAGELHRQTAYNLGAAGFLQKPFRASDVESALADVGLLAVA